MKPPQPEVVINWRKRLNEPIPRCCHTCDHYLEDATCRVFGMSPPDDFAATMNVCESWEEEIPF